MEKQKRKPHTSTSPVYLQITFEVLSPKERSAERFGDEQRRGETHELNEET